MPNYSKTIIYKIQHEDNEEIVYVGSTTNFTERKSHHKSKCNNPNDKGYNYKLYQMIRDNGGWECFRMVQLKEFSCNNKREAQLEEDRIMLELKTNMNSYRACRSKTEYILDNIDKFKQYHKEYRLENEDKIKEYQKDYRQDNSEKIKEKQKQYREKYSETIKENNKTKVICECNCEISRHCLSRHKKSTKHIGRILLQQTI